MISKDKSINLKSSNYCITNDSIKHQLFVSTQLNAQTVQFQTFHVEFICTQFKCLFDPQMGPFHELPLRAGMDLGIIAMNRYSAFPKDP